MKKHMITLLLALTVVVSLIGRAIPTLATDGDITLRFHY